jgi:hypothetical protein
MPQITLPARPFLQVDAQQLVGVEEGLQILGQELHDRRQVRQHANMAANAVRIFRQFDGDLFDIEQRDTGMVQQRFASRRQRHALGQPPEQRDAERQFEIVHPLGDGRCRDALALRRPRQVLLLADRDEQPQRRQVDPARQRGFGRLKSSVAGSREIEGFERHGSDLRLDGRRTVPVRLA